MTVPSSPHRAGCVLRCVLVLVAVLVSSLCTAGQSAAELVRAGAASAAVDARPAAGADASLAAGEQGRVDVHQAAGPLPSGTGTGHCGKQAALDTAVARDGSRPSAPLPAPEREEHRTPAAPTGPGPTSGSLRPGLLAPDPIQLSVLRI
ncbi:hypothetical protein EES46_08345 [Streptomyces sp. ADI98-10]|nr:hypothetical protein EES46_08345 [Streptomyces sp. ADI98-10]